MRWVCVVIMWSLQTRIEKSFSYSISYSYSNLKVPIKPNPAGLELGWVTDKKYPLLYAIFFVCLLPFYFSFLSFFLSLLFLRTKPLVDIFIITIFIFFLILLQKI